MAMIRLGAAVAMCFAAALGAAPMLAQSVAQVGGPAEAPPAGFTGQQYVDSRGCVFMRAGFSGRTTWVPRIGRDRNPICNEVTPAQAAARLAQGDVGAAPSGVGAPMETVASAMGSGKRTGVFAPIAVPGLTSGQPARAPVPMPRKAYAPVAIAPPPAAVQNRGSHACPAHAPVLQALPLTTGGSVTVCTRGDGTATGWVSPVGRGVGGTIRDGLSHGYGQGQVQGHLQAGYAGTAMNSAAQGGAGGYVQTVIAGQPVIAPRREAGAYAPAWKDDRLNPLRGLGTQQGWAQQAQVWSSKTPAQTFEELASKKARKQAAQGGAAQRVTASTMSAGAQVASGGQGGLFVQVGTFGQSANAQNAAGRLAGLGLPVASAKSLGGGAPLVAIMAGPFASAAQAQQALAMARSLGFADAYIR